MIKIENDIVKISGYPITLQLEFVGIVKALVDATKGAIDRTDIEHCVDIAFMTEAEKKQKYLDLLKAHVEIMGILNEAMEQAKQDEKESNKADAVATMDENLMKDVFGEMAMKDGVVSD